MTFEERRTICTFATVVRAETEDDNLIRFADEIGLAAEFGMMFPDGEERQKRADEARLLLNEFVAAYEIRKRENNISAVAIIRIDKAVKDIGTALQKLSPAA